MNHAQTILQEAGIRATANRILVMKVLEQADRTLSIREIEDRIDSIDKSSVFRVLRLFADHHLLHEIDDGTGEVKYERCTAHCHSPLHDDQHVHFFCLRCKRTFCLNEIPIPQVDLPDGFTQQSRNFVVKGICPSCAS